MRIIKITLPLLLLTLLAVGPAAAVSYLSIDWTGSTRTINFTITGTSITGANIALAAGSTDGTLDMMQSAGYQLHRKLYCVDVFNFAQDSAWPGNAREWDVARYTEADGETGWTTPLNDSDHHRVEGGLARAAFLANKYTYNGWLDTDDYNKRMALNVAIWKACYGDKFTYTGGLTAIQEGYLATYMAAYNTGATANQYIWYDNNADDTQDIYQDFLNPVPEPASLLLLGLGVGAAGLARFRRRRG